MFYRGPLLTIDMTFNFGEGSESSHEILGAVWNYPSLKGTASSLDWPQGVGTGVSGLNFYDNYGIESWSIDAGPGQVPGKLSVACYKPGSAPDAPDAFVEFNLGPGSWGSGSLPVSNAEFPEDQFLTAYIRFVPEHLQTLL